jgi:hypothetical protein
MARKYSKGRKKGERAGRPAAQVPCTVRPNRKDFVSGEVGGGMAPPAAQAQLLLSNHPSPLLSPPQRRRLLGGPPQRRHPSPLLSPPQRRRLLGGPPPRSHTCAIRHHHGHDKCASSSTRLRHALRPPAATAVAIAPGDHWGNWAFLLSAAAFGTW